MPVFEPAELIWRKSSPCDPSECIEVANWGDRVLIRDSKDMAGSILDVRLNDWHTFIRDVTTRFSRDHASAVMIAVSNSNALVKD
jgi:Domain of unknown function (DUF397)